MQTTMTAITIPAGAIIGGGPFNAWLTLRQPITVQAQLHSAKGQPRIGDDWYSFEYGGWDCRVMADRVAPSEPDPTPEPTPEPEPEPTITSKRQPRQSREAQYNQRVQAAYESIRAMGHRHENDLLELFSVASQSAEGLRYQVAHDLVSGRMHCTCLAGVNERASCVHRAAVARWLSERAAQINQAVNQAVNQAAQVRQAAADRARDTSILRRSNQPFNLMR